MFRLLPFMAAWIIADIISQLNSALTKLMCSACRMKIGGIIF